MNKQTVANDTRHEIIRIQKRQNPYVMLDKRFLENNQLSFKAKGLLAYLLSKPDQWKVIVKDLMNHATDGRDSVYSGLKELKLHGYYSKTPVRNEKGVVTHWDSVIFEDPSENPEYTASYPLTGFPHVDNQDADFPNAGLAERSNNDLSNNNFSKIQSNLIPSVEPTVNEVEHKTDEIRLDKKEEQTYIREENKGEENKAGGIKKGFQNATTIPSSNAIMKAKPEYDYTTVEEIIKGNIGYDDIISDAAVGENLLDEIVQVTTATICSQFKDGYVSMGEQKIPAEAVKNVFFKLNRDDIEYFAECFDRNPKEVKKFQAYMRTALYRNHATIEHHYANLYRANNPYPGKPNTQRSYV